MAENLNGINPIRFEQTPDTRYFMCRHCRNHVMSWENYIGQAVSGNAILCHNPINVRDDTIAYYTYLQVPVMKVSCNECNRNIGLRFVEVRVLAPDPVIMEERFGFYKNEMVQWNGTQLVYADTNEPVVDDGIP